jgi:DNA ligase-1
MGEVAVEPKYDGVRVQIHVYKDGRVRTFSRNLEDTTAMFPELTGIQKHLNAREIILDGEAIGLDPKTGKLISFQETMTRKRKHDITRMMSSVPLKFFVFDILYKDGEDLLSHPLSFRRDMLLTSVKPGAILVASPQIVTGDEATLRAYHEKQRKAGLEGVVVKKWNSPYEPGRRGYNWVKFKEEEGKTGKLTDTIDGLIMGFYRGEGKRASFGIGAFLVGVAKGDTFVTVTKIGTGVSDELWKELHTRLNGIKTSKQPKQYVDVNKLLIPDVWVTPTVVVEVAADDITRSPIHGAGVALRFPRLVGIRADKSPREATTVAEVRAMYTNQDGTHKNL